MSNPIAFAAISGTSPTTTSLYPSFQNIPGLSVTVNAAAGDQFLVTLTMPDTWNDTAGGGGWFAITCNSNSNIIARGLFSSATAGQRVPISLQMVLVANQTGAYQFAAQFCSYNHGTVYVGSWSQSVLTVLRAW